MTNNEMIHEAHRIAEFAHRLDNDVNGNPRYYLPMFMFARDNGSFYRPSYATKYRGKKYGAGWVFQSYSLSNDIYESLKNDQKNV
jgi:hypothetical protein